MKKLLFILEEAIPVAAVFIILAVSFVQVVFRYALNNALPWPEEVARMLMVTSTFIGCGIVAREGKHLEIDCAKHLFGHRVKVFATHVSTIATLVFCVVMLVLSIGMIQFVAESGQETASYHSPYWMYWLAIPMGMALMALRTVTHYLQELRNLKAEKESIETNECTYADTLPGGRCGG